MADERSRAEASQALTEALGPRAAAALMECIPPFPWTELATKTDLRELEQRLDERFTLRLETGFHRAETRIIKWTVGAVFGGIAAIGAATAGIAALVS